MSEYWENEQVEISNLLGKTITSIVRETGDDELRFVCSDEATYVMYHDQDCCESVSIEDIVGDIDDLIGNPLLQAEEVTNMGIVCIDWDKEKDDPLRYIVQGEWPDEIPLTKYSDSYTWTFYKLATIKGGVTIRWFGESNGCYSERVNIARTDVKR